MWAWPLDRANADADPSSDLASDLALLDAGELDRYHRFHFERDRSRFAVAHAEMRRILGAYLDRPPSSLRFRANRFGKPEIEGEAAIRFNLSHTSGLDPVSGVAVLALSLDTEVGIDIEEIHDIETEVARQNFSQAELSALGSLAGEEWLWGFYRCWTRKEAILKAEGVGLNLPLDAFDVSLLPGAPAELLGTKPAAAHLHPWKLHDVSPGGRLVAALAAGNAEAEIRCFALASRS